MSNFQKNLNEKALRHVSTLSRIRMDRKNYDHYIHEIGHSSYFGVGREILVILDDAIEGVDFDLQPSKSPIYKR